MGDYFKGAPGGAGRPGRAGFKGLKGGTNTLITKQAQFDCVENNHICFAHVGDNGACECSTVLSPDGPDGPVGERGDAGMTGEFGQEGDVGDPGPQGEDGIPVRI